MFKSPLDEIIADQLVCGSVQPEDAPPGYSEVALLLNAARGVAPAPMPGREAAVSNIVATIRLAPGPSVAPTEESRRRVSKFFTLKALAIALPVMALTAGSAAAATGSLPGPAQSAVSHGLSHVGISVPSGTAVGPDAAGPAKAGLCEAYQASLAHGQAADHSVAFANLAKAAGGASNIPAYCAGVVHSSNGSDTTGPGTNSSGSHGTTTTNPADTHSGSTPNGPPASVPGGPPSSVPANPNAGSVPGGPPSSVPANPHAGSVPGGPPASVPVGSPNSNPGASHRG
jgi:hypothetical protein